VSATLTVRRDRFAKHIQRVVAHVRQTKGWSLSHLLREADVTKPVYYRWIKQEWVQDPEPGSIERFHDAAGWPVADAFDILWPGKYGRREPTPAAPLPPEVEAILRKLNDPNTSPEDLYLIQATLEMLISRIAPGAGRRRA
jgi:hypothetical protein